MKDIIIKRNKLRDDAMKLRRAKFDKNVSAKHSFEMDKEQDKLWKKYKFFDNFLKAKK